jgi:hypothetical protein
MKKLFSALILALVFSTGFTPSLAQSKDAYWVIEGNPQIQRHIMIRYYDRDRRLIGEERVEKKWIDISQRRNIKMLNRKLQRRLELDSMMRLAAAKKN